MSLRLHSIDCSFPGIPSQIVVWSGRSHKSRSSYLTVPFGRAARTPRHPACPGHARRVFSVDCVSPTGTRSARRGCGSTQADAQARSDHLDDMRRARSGDCIRLLQPLIDPNGRSGTRCAWECRLRALQAARSPARPAGHASPAIRRVGLRHGRQALGGPRAAAARQGGKSSPFAVTVDDHPPGRTPDLPHSAREAAAPGRVERPLVIG